MARKVLVFVVTAICLVGTLAYCLVVKPAYEATASVLLEPPISQTLIEANYPTASPPCPTCPTGSRSSRAPTSPRRWRKPSRRALGHSHPGRHDRRRPHLGPVQNPQPAAAAANAYSTAYIALRAATDDRHLQLGPGPAPEQGQHGQLAIANLNAQIQAAPAGTNLTPDETQLGDLQDQLANLQNQLQNYQFYSSQGVTTEVGQVISSATVPTKPVSPKTVEWTILALIFGVILGIGVALLVNAVAPRD